uniref:Uncharacterized protein n=1 Tax=viral metagenome TaxID=1070528 RepID=A0A6C0JWD5_9ZZZZ
MNDGDYLCVMSELKFIGSVKEGQFLNSTTGRIENKNILSCLVRQFMYPQETGQTSAKFCMNTTAKALKLLSKYKNIQGSEEYVKIIIKYITDAKIGMTHLKETHSDNNLAYAIFDFAITNIIQTIGAGE